MQKRLNKKGQDLSIGTLILIVLGIIVLVLLVLGFSLGWSNLWEKINIFGGTSSIGDIVSACQIKITSNDNYGFCNTFTKVNVGNNEKQYISCEDSRVMQSLSSPLTCSGETNTRIIEQCKGISQTEREKFKVNTQDCLSESICTTAGGALTAPEGNKCPSNGIEILSGKRADNKLCCIAAPA